MASGGGEEEAVWTAVAAADNAVIGGTARSRGPLELAETVGVLLEVLVARPSLVADIAAHDLASHFVRILAAAAV